MILSIQRENWWCSLFVHFSKTTATCKNSLCPTNTVASIIQYLWSHFDSNDFLRLNCPILRLALSYRLKLATTFEKPFLAFFDSSFWLSWTKYRCMRTPFSSNNHLFWTYIVWSRVQQQNTGNLPLIKNCATISHKCGDDGKGKNDGMLVFPITTIITTRTWLLIFIF